MKNPGVRWFLTVAVCLFPVPFTALRAHQRILFVGNSLTVANDLPGMVAALAQSAEKTRWTCESVAFPDFSLEDHWNRGDAVKAIARGGWSTVILQQGPSALPESRALLIEYTKRFDTEIKRTGARTALYMVWPSFSRRSDFDAVSASYTAAAKAVGGLLLPVGDAWRAAWKRDSELALYGSDGFHPTMTGTYLTGLVIYGRLAGRSPVSDALMPALFLRSGATVNMPRAIAGVLQQAAADVISPASKR